MIPVNIVLWYDQLIHMVLQSVGIYLCLAPSFEVFKDSWTQNNDGMKPLMNMIMAGYVTRWMSVFWKIIFCKLLPNWEWVPIGQRFAISVVISGASDMTEIRICKTGYLWCTVVAPPLKGLWFIVSCNGSSFWRFVLDEHQKYIKQFIFSGSERA